MRKAQPKPTSPEEFTKLLVNLSRCPCSESQHWRIPWPKTWQWQYVLGWSFVYHAGFCVLQERVIFQTHLDLLENTLKQKIKIMVCKINKFLTDKILSKCCLSVSTFFLKLWSPSDHKSLVAHGLIGPHWSSLYWLGFRLLAKTGRSDCAQCPHAAT